MEPEKNAEIFTSPLLTDGRDLRVEECTSYSESMDSVEPQFPPSDDPAALDAELLSEEELIGPQPPPATLDLTISVAGQLDALDDYVLSELKKESDRLEMILKEKTPKGRKKVTSPLDRAQISTRRVSALRALGDHADRKLNRKNSSALESIARVFRHIENVMVDAKVPDAQKTLILTGLAKSIEEEEKALRTAR